MYSSPEKPNFWPFSRFLGRFHNFARRFEAALGMPACAQSFAFGVERALSKPPLPKQSIAHQPTRILYLFGSTKPQLKAWFCIAVREHPSTAAVNDFLGGWLAGCRRVVFAIRSIRFWT
jgi:hypothetical protein